MLLLDLNWELSHESATCQPNERMGRVGKPQTLKIQYQPAVTGEQHTHDKTSEISPRIPDVTRKSHVHLHARIRNRRAARVDLAEASTQGPATQSMRVQAVVRGGVELAKDSASTLLRAYDRRQYLDL